MSLELFLLLRSGLIFLDFGQCLMQQKWKPGRKNYQHFIRSAHITKQAELLGLRERRKANSAYQLYEVFDCITEVRGPFVLPAERSGKTEPELLGGTLDCKPVGPFARSLLFTSKYK